MNGWKQNKKKTLTNSVNRDGIFVEEVKVNDSITITMNKKKRESNRMKSFDEHNVTKMRCEVDRPERRSCKSSGNILVQSVGQRGMVVL